MTMYTQPTSQEVRLSRDKKLLELQAMPRVDGKSWGAPAPQAQFNAFADAVLDMYQRHGRPNRDGVVPFSAKTAQRIRSRNNSSWSVAMKHVVSDIGHVDVLLTIKRLIFT